MRIQFLLFLWLTSASSYPPLFILRNKHQFIEKGRGRFDEYMLTRIYPVAVCRADDDTVPDSCEIPPETPTWSIHGLWPERKDGSYPQFCDGIPKKFDPDLVKKIEEDLKHEWPNLFPEKSVESFWKHEYEKHGTCAQTDSRFGTELLYFNSTITLHKKFNVEEALKMGNIVPREKPYDTEEIQNVLNQYLGNDHYVQMHCLSDKKTGQTLFADTRLCVDLEWKPVDCPKERRDFANVEILGKRQPLPSFKDCSGNIIYLEDGKINDETVPVSYVEDVDEINVVIVPVKRFPNKKDSKELFLSPLRQTFPAVAMTFINPFINFFYAVFPASNSINLIIYCFVASFALVRFAMY